MSGEDPEAPWLPLAEAGRRTGRHPDTLRAMIRRGRLSGRKSNGGAWLVQLPTWMASESGPEGRPNGSGGSPDDDPEIDPEEIALLRHELVQASTRAARAEGELSGLREALTRADTALAQARGDLADARKELAEARKPMLVRFVEAIRRR